MGYLKVVSKMYSICSNDYVFFLPLLFAICWMLFNLLNALIILAVTLPFFGKKLFIIAKTFRRDIKCIRRLYGLIKAVKHHEKNNSTVGEIFRKHVSLNPNKSCFLFKDSVWTYQNVEDYSIKVANVFNQHGYKAGDTIALMMNNRPEYVCIWLGLSKLGIITALINPNLRGKSLSHCIETVKSKAIIYHSEFSEVIDDICDPALPKYKFTDGSVTQNLPLVLNGRRVLNNYIEFASRQFPKTNHSPSFQDDMLYIYTSGTTGLPKAAVIRNSRYILGGMATKYCCSLRDDDIVYNCLPLCHTSGGCLAAGLSVICGITTVIKSKFSASNYFSDCKQYNATVAMYIGEMCRYILSSTKEGTEVQHNLRALIGNGLRPTIWSKIVKRFHIPEIFEFYGATEGNVNMANIDNKLGAVGCIPNLIPSFLIPIALIQIDLETGLPKRNMFGLCNRCLPGEPGMLVGLIEPKDPTRHFAGYANKVESEKKVIQNVFTLGDSAFASGDILVMDELGYVYFKDRTGDTFRWKGENVSTCEVESVMSCFAGLKDCVVYGVQVGDYEGRAGAAAIVESEKGSVDLPALAHLLDSSLPPYARPIFIRILPSVSMTSTFKLRKVEVEKLGIDPSLNPPNHQLYFRKSLTFIPFTQELHSAVLSGTVRI